MIKSVQYCLHCGKPLNKTQKKFCSKSCSASFTNKGKIHSESSRHKCSESIKRIRRHTERICKVCGCSYYYVKHISTKIFCSHKCFEYYKLHKNEFLSPDSIRRMSEGGRKSMDIQKDSRRSRNEIKFCSLCKEKFGTDAVLHNIPYFNGWDADVIIPELKIAILWNGAWHYKQIYDKSSLIQIKNRDNIKISEIKKAGFIPYVIKDLGKANSEFVKNQFNIFCKWIDDLSESER